MIDNQTFFEITSDPFPEAWRTPDVVAVCRGIRETQDYSGTPILADSLQEAGCTDERLLGAFRDPAIWGATWRAERLVAIVYSRATETAVRALEAFAQSVRYDYQTAVEAGRKYLVTGDAYVDPEGMNWDASNAMDDAGVTAYWRLYELVTGHGIGREVTENDSAFQCPC